MSPTILASAHGHPTAAFACARATAKQLRREERQLAAREQLEKYREPLIGAAVGLRHRYWSEISTTFAGDGLHVGGRSQMVWREEQRAITELMRSNQTSESLATIGFATSSTS